MSNSVTAIESVSQSETGPIIMSSVFKSGTWLLRFIVERLTGLSYYEPPIKAGAMDPTDPDLISIKTGHFYSWHFIPSPPVQEKLIRINARPIFLMRNIYDLVVSMYYHFANNIDHEIGRGANKHGYFSRLGKDAGIQKIITGCDDTEFKWRGIGPHLHQMECMFQFASVFPCHLASYEDIVSNKAKSIPALAEFLDISLSLNDLDELVRSSGFDAMKYSALKQNKASHFRQGKIQSHTHELSLKHIQEVQECLEKYAPKLAPLATLAGFNSLLNESIAQ